MAKKRGATREKGYLPSKGPARARDQSTLLNLTPCSLDTYVRKGQTKVFPTDREPAPSGHWRLRIASHERGQEFSSSCLPYRLQSICGCSVAWAYPLQDLTSEEGRRKERLPRPDPPRPTAENSKRARLPSHPPPSRPQQTHNKATCHTRQPKGDGEGGRGQAGTDGGEHTSGETKAEGRGASVPLHPVPTLPTQGQD